MKLAQFGRAIDVVRPSKDLLWPSAQGADQGAIGIRLHERHLLLESRWLRPVVVVPARDVAPAGECDAAVKRAGKADVILMHDT